MKFQIFFRRFGIPVIILSAIFLVRWMSGFTPFYIFAEIVFAVAVLSSRLLSDTRYIKSFIVREDRILISYLTQLLAARTVEIKLSEITEATLSPQKKLALWPPALRLKIDNEWMEFRILSNEIHRSVQTQLPATQDQGVTRLSHQ